MSKLTKLINNVDTARNDFLTLTKNTTEQQAAIKPSADTWNIIDIIEHLFWAEQGALFGMWKTLYAVREGTITGTYDSPHRDWSIEKLIEQTWKEKEQVPEMAKPRLGGTLAFWRHSFKGLQPLLEAFGNELNEDELRLQAHPHPISGAMDFQQRLEFLSFHIHRHRRQVQTIMERIS